MDDQTHNPPVVVDRSEAREERATPNTADLGGRRPERGTSGAETPAATSGPDPVSLWLASDSVKELDADLNEAFGHLQRGFEMLLSMGVDGEIGALGPDRLITMAQRLEAHRTRLLLVDSYVIEAATEERLNDHVCVGSIAQALATSLHISTGAAAGRIKRAEQLLPQNGFSSGITPPRLPVLADAVRNGTGVSTDQVDVILTAMTRVQQNSDLDHEKRELAEQILVQQAAALSHLDLKKVADHIEDAVNPDGAIPDEQVAQARRGVVIGPLGRDGTHKLTGFLTREGKALFDAAIGPLAAPRPADDTLGADDRSAAQRTHDGLQDAFKRLLDLAGVPASGGTAATVHITIDIDQLRDAIARLHDDHNGRSAQRAAGTVAGGDRLTIGELMRLAREATLIPVWISNTKGIVAYGRERRTASPAQTHALIARDAGCSFPGCDAPPDWCQRHHVVPWWIGGQTDLDNLTLVCGYHHREFEKHGWAVTIANGIPAWVPPRWIDPDQTPQINARIKIPCQDQIDQIAAAAKHAREEQYSTLQVEHLIDPAEDIDELIQLIATHITPQQRDDFYTDAARLLGDYLTADLHSEHAESASDG